MKVTNGKCVALVALLLGNLGVVPAIANMAITEYMYSGRGGEFVEFTNVGDTPIDMTGWSFDDDSRIPGVFDLSGFGIVAPGQSVIITEDDSATFIADWSLSGVVVLGGYTNNLGRNDEINLFDATDTLVDRLTYGDGTFPGTIRTQYVSGNPGAPAALGENDIYQWVLSEVGDGFGSYLSANYDIGNPGYYVPEPGTLALLVLPALLALVRRRG
jgi:uncharacterized protein (TIGR03382 family)